MKLLDWKEDMIWFQEIHLRVLLLETWDLEIEPRELNEMNFLLILIETLDRMSQIL